LSLASTGRSNDVGGRDRDQTARFDVQLDGADRQRHVFRIRRFKADLLEMEDAHFHTDSAVMLPERDPCIFPCCHPTAQKAAALEESLSVVVCYGRKSTTSSMKI
jgi:hypothetical protein